MLCKTTGVGCVRRLRGVIDAEKIARRTEAAWRDRTALEVYSLCDGIVVILLSDRIFDAFVVFDVLSSTLF